MGFLDSLMGRASEVDASKMQHEFASILVEGERIERAAGSFDYDAELKIWISGGDKISKEFNKKLSVYKLRQVLAGYVLR